MNDSDIQMRKLLLRLLLLRAETSTLNRVIANLNNRVLRDEKAELEEKLEWAKLAASYASDRLKAVRQNKAKVKATLRMRLEKLRMEKEENK